MRRGTQYGHLCSTNNFLDFWTSMHRKRYLGTLAYLHLTADAADATIKRSLPLFVLCQGTLAVLLT